MNYVKGRLIGVMCWNVTSKLVAHLFIFLAHDVVPGSGKQPKATWTALTDSNGGCVEHIWKPRLWVYQERKRVSFFFFFNGSFLLLRKISLAFSPTLLVSLICVISFTMHICGSTFIIYYCNFWFACKLSTWLCWHYLFWQGYTAIFLVLSRHGETFRNH